MKKAAGVEVQVVKQEDGTKLLSQGREYDLQDREGGLQGCFKVLVPDNSGKLRKGDLGEVVQAAGFEGNGRWLVINCEALAPLWLEGAKLLFSSQITRQDIQKQYERRSRKCALTVAREEKEKKVKRFKVEAEVLSYSSTYRSMQTTTLGETGINCFNGERHEVFTSINAKRDISKIRRQIHHCPGCGARIRFNKID